MKSYFLFSVSALLIAAIIYFIADSLAHDSGAAVGIITLTGWISIIIFSANHSRELGRGHW